MIDLDGAMESGANDFLVRRICHDLPCRVGGGVRSVDRARQLLDAGAHAVIVSSALFRDGRPDLAFAEQFEGRFISQRDEDRSIEETLGIGWELLAGLPVDVRFVYRSDGAASPDRSGQWAIEGVLVAAR